MTKRAWTLLGACAIGAVAFALWPERGDGPRVRPAHEAEETAPPRRRWERPRTGPSFAEGAGPLAVREARERHDAPVVNGVVQIGPRGSDRAAAVPPKAERRSGGAWATSYAAAMCECRTRACAADLQGDFIRAMSGVEYDEARDGAAYDEAIRRAVHCALALPEGT